MARYNPLDLLVRKLRARAPMSPEDEAAVLALPVIRRMHAAGACLIREGSTSLFHCSLILSGFAYRQKIAEDGARQIVSLQLPGDFTDLQHVLLRRADHDVLALPGLVTLDIERPALRALIRSHPAVGRAMWTDGLIEASIYREWMLNTGRRDGRARIAHLLCEFAVRMRAADQGDGSEIDLPMSQEQLGDAVGLTDVHVHRTLKALAEDGLIAREKRRIRFLDWEATCRAAGFHDHYLHLDQIESADPA